MSAARLAKSAIKIPQRIERSPTDILKALASTVRYLPGEPEHFLADDPYLLPKRAGDSRRFTIAKLSGVRTAKYFLKKYPELFFRDDAEPKVEAFATPEEFRTDMELTEEDMKWCLENRDVPNALIAYQSLEERGVRLDTEILLQFFELLCYTNEDAIPDIIDRENSRLAGDSGLIHYTWKTNGLASKIFNKIKESDDSPRAYSAMIAGLCKHNEHSTALQVFEDFKEHHQDHGLFAVAYSGLLESVPSLNSSTSTANEAIQEIVKHMEAHLVAPNLDVFNAIIKCYSNYNVDETTCEKTLKLVNDMLALNIHPTLGTYANIIGVLSKCRQGRIREEMIQGIIAYISRLNASEFLLDRSSTTFLNQSMAAVAHRLNNLKLAHKVHSIYLKNPQLFSSLRDRTRYLNTYFKLIITTDSLDNILDFYKTYVPSSFCPSPDCYEALAEALDLYQAPKDVVSKIGRDILNFKLALKIKNDAIFRNADPNYANDLEKAI